MLCGFGAEEIARIYLASVAAIEKRVSRGKKVLGGSQHLFELTAGDFAPRLSAVHRALYLLFSEGYHGACDAEVIRAELCRQAMRLARLLVDHAPAATPATYALAALMYLGAARLPGRTDEMGDLTALLEQDRSRWDGRLIAEGLALLDLAATGSELSEYHLEAAIAGVHATATRFEDTRWDEIVRLYDLLLRVRPSPIVALNRAMAIAQLEGAMKGLDAIAAIAGAERLGSYPFYPAALGELELRCGKRETACTHFQEALGLARNDAERRFLARRVEDCGLSCPRPRNS
jgi:RNA polymerase sigma-70 factor (ECF subfamily)